MLGCVSCRELRFIILKLEIKLIGVIIKDAVSNILYRVKPNIFSTEYKELIFKEV